MKTYAQKRDFTKTPEPDFGKSSADRGELRFVIQRHEASHLHFDVRLECDGALKSWAVPKGPSLDPKVKHAAIMVEDHPLDYANFEGRIPKGQYGGGEVVIWDEGTYSPEDSTGNRRADEAKVREGLAEGKLAFMLYGSRLRGGFVLVRTKNDDTWLLIKRDDEFATEEDPTRDESSVRSGITAVDLRAGRSPISKSDPFPEHPGLMVPREVEKPFTDDCWSFEPKLDGVRALAVKRGKEIALITRNDKDVADRFPSIVRDLSALPDENLILDGELVLLDPDGRPSFEALMDSYHARKAVGGVLAYMAFDCLYASGQDLRAKPFSERRLRVEQAPLAGSLRLIDSVAKEGELLFKEAQRLGFEGIVAKKLASPYRGGATDQWLKVKGYHSEEFLIGGYTPGTGARAKTFGALIVGRRQEDGKLRYCGNVGGGFDDEQLEALKGRLDALRVKASPFDGEIASKGKPVFVEPKLLAEVKFMTWTRDGKLRFPIFQRLRPDLEPSFGTTSTLERSHPPADPNTVSPPAADAPTKTDPFNDLLRALETEEKELRLTVEGSELKFTSLGKQLWLGVTKRDLLAYFVRVSDTFLRYLRDRPLTFVRYPNGIEGEGFFQRHWSEGLPDFVETAEIYSESGHSARRHLLCNNLATLLWLGQNAAIEIHPWHSRITPDPDAPDLKTRFDKLEDLEKSVLEYPDYMVLDLDPNIRSGKEKAGAEPELNEEGWKRTVEVAHGLRDMLGQLNLRGFVKTTGKTGLHIYVPLQRRYTSDQVREATRTIGQHLMAKMPEQLTMEIRLNRRPDKVYFDANMNGRTKTLAAAYSPRPVPGARVSMPIRWDRLDSVRPDDFTVATVPEILQAEGDAWGDFLSVAQRLP